MRRSPKRIVLASALAFAGSLPLAAQEPSKPPQSDSPLSNPPISTTLTCHELNVLLHSENSRRTGGLAIIWLDGYYAGNAAIAEFPADWTRIVSQGVGAICGIGNNGSRPVLDVIAELRRQATGGSPLKQ
jgi:hypothetical protein